MANVQPGHNVKHLRRDQLLDNYEAAEKTLQTLIRAKENELAYRKDLIKMLEESKSYHDNRLMQAKQEYQTAKSHIPESVDLKSKPTSFKRSTTPPFPPPQSLQQTTPSSVAFNHSSANLGNLYPDQQQASTASQSSHRHNADLDIHAHGDSHESRGSLDRRLSELAKKFPNLTQTGMAPTSNTEQQQPQSLQQQQMQMNKPTPGYYIQQPAIPSIQMLAAPPSIELLRYPPPFFPRNDRNTN